MRSISRKEIMMAKLIRTLNYSFKNRIEVGKNFIEIKPSKITIYEYLLVLLLVLFPFVVCLFLTKSTVISVENINRALNVWPISLIFFVICLYIFITGNILNNHVIIDIGNNTFVIESNPFIGESKKYKIDFNEIDSFNFKRTPNSKETTYILILRLKNGVSINVLDFNSAETTSQILNYFVEKYKVDNRIII